MRAYSVALTALIASIATAKTADMPTGLRGFNSGAFKTDYSSKMASDFEEEMTTAQNLVGSPGVFNSMRLYTNIQDGTKDTPISAFDAAIKTNTTLLLGIWCSDVTNIDAELKALMSAINDKGSALADLIVAISVGSEDLYRVSEAGIRNKAGVGTSPDKLLGFIRDTRAAIKGTLLANVPVGHVDTWNVWTNTSNQPVLDAVDFAGADLYPYYEDDKGNAFSNITNVWDYTYGLVSKATKKAGKPLWVTETGYPTTGPKWGEAVPSLNNAAEYWQEIGCNRLFADGVNTWWYNLRDSNPDNKQSFAITDDLNTTPKFDLTCSAKSGAPAPVNKNGGEESDDGDSAAVSIKVGGLLLAATAVASLLNAIY
jgi:glucan endo-1,3-beta-D-glucosidase